MPCYRLLHRRYLFLLSTLPALTQCRPLDRYWNTPSRALSVTMQRQYSEPSVIIFSSRSLSQKSVYRRTDKHAKTPLSQIRQDNSGFFVPIKDFNYVFLYNIHAFHASFDCTNRYCDIPSGKISACRSVLSRTLI